MTHARSSASHGEWMDVAHAARYAGVARGVLDAALRHGELSSTAAEGWVSPVRVHSHAVEVWAAQRESRLDTLVG